MKQSGFWVVVLFAMASLVASSGAIALDSSGRLVVTGFGGIWKESIEKNFISCFKERTGTDAVVQLGESADWLNRIRANPNKPPIDVVTLAQADNIRAVKEGLLEPLDMTKLPNIKDIPPVHYKIWDNKAVDIHIGALGVMYNKEAIPTPPKDWKTLFDNIAAGKYGKRVSIPSGTYTWGPDFLWFIAQLYDGKIDTAFAKVKAMEPYVTKFWTGPVEALNLFGAKEVDLVVYWDGRAHAFIEKGNPWAGYYNPAPRSLGVTVSVAKVKNSSEMAWSYIDCAISARAQLGHAKTLGYAITNKTVVYPPDLKQKISDVDQMVFLPYGDYIDQFPGWIERWNREVR